MKDFNKDWEQYNFESVTPVISWPWNWVPKKKRNRSLNPECLSDPNICKQIFWSRARGDGLLRAVVKDRECEVPKGCCRLFSELHSLGLWTAIILMWLLQDQGKEKSIWGKKEEKKKKKMRKGEYRSCAFTFIWDLLHSCSRGHPLQSLHPLPSTQLAH